MVDFKIQLSSFTQETSKPMSKRKAVSYIRMSTEEQLRGHSLQRQNKLALDYCEEKDFELVEELNDIGLSGYSGKNIQKGKLGLFLQGIRDGEVDKDIVLLVENLDRLSRQNPLTALTQFSEILTYGIEIHTLFDRQIYTQEEVGNNMGLLFLSIGQMIRAYDESKTKSQRLKSVWEKKRDNGEIITSLSPLWVNPVKDESGKTVGFELDPIQSGIVRKIFEMTIDQNMGSYAITRYLNQNLDKFPRGSNKTKDWGHSYIKKILTNPNVYGLFQPHKMVDGKQVAAGEPIKDYFPAVITEEEFNLAQERIKSRINGGGPAGHCFANLFAGLIYCADCGGNVRLRNRGKNHSSSTKLQCSHSHQGKSNCDALGWDYEDFQNLFLKTVSDMSFIEIFKNDDQKRKRTDLELEIANKKSILQKNEVQVQNLIDNMMDSGLSTTVLNSITARLNKLGEETDALKESLASLKSDYESLLGRPTKDVQDQVMDDIRKVLAGDSGHNSEELEVFRREFNLSLKKIINRIEIQTQPYLKEEVEITDLDERFLDWFWDSRTKRSTYHDPLEFIKTNVGAALYSSYVRSIRIEFKNKEVRLVNNRGKMLKAEMTGETLEEILSGSIKD